MTEKGKWGEPWEVGTGYGAAVVFDAGRTDDPLAIDMGPENAARAVACVNALDGLNPEGVGRVVEILMYIDRNGPHGDECSELAESALRALGVEP